MKKNLYFIIVEILITYFSFIILIKIFFPIIKNIEYIYIYLMHLIVPTYLKFYDEN